MNSTLENSRQPSSLNQIWHILIDDHQEGPYSYLELSKDDRLTPETLAWRQGMENWLPIGQIDELKRLFDHQEESSKKKEDIEKFVKAPDEQIVLDLPNGGGPGPVIWIILIFLAIFYALYEFLWSQ